MGAYKIMFFFCCFFFLRKLNIFPKMNFITDIRVDKLCFSVKI